jgi:hypothetical protein
MQIGTTIAVILTLPVAMWVMWQMWKLFWKYRLRRLERKVAKKAEQARKECIKLFLDMASYLYHRPTTFDVRLEPYSRGSWPWQKGYRIIMVVSLSEKDDYKRAQLMVDRFLKKFIDRRGNRRLRAVGHYTLKPSLKEK